MILDLVICISNNSEGKEIMLLFYRDLPEQERFDKPSTSPFQILLPREGDYLHAYI